jgi:phosphate uptake regulator
MVTLESIEENFRFLALEVVNQAKATASFLDAPSHALFDKIVSRDDYIDNLKNIIENKSFSKIHSDAGITKRSIDHIRALHIIAVNLERIADFCVNVVKQMAYFSDPHFLKRFDHQAMMQEIVRGLTTIQAMGDKEDLSAALAVCRCEHTLDSQYKESFDRIMAMLRTGLQVENLLTTLFIFRYLERIGDSLLNIGEAMIFSIIGEKIKIEQFQALQQTLNKSGFSGSISDIDFQSIWGTRSGCRISRVGAMSQDLAQGSIFKEGALAKVRKEKENIESWDIVSPGIGPKIFSYHEEGDKASMLVEFLSGCTLEEMVLTTAHDDLMRVISLFEQALTEVWEETEKPGPAPTDYMGQLSSRLDAVRQVHKNFERPVQYLNLTRVPSTRELLKICADIEQTLPAPRTVFIHGDFNVNNIVYDHARERIHFIDLYRSKRADLVQDVSVFLVSNFRLPVTERHLRDRIALVNREFLHFALEWAEQKKDETFQARLALALSRSFFTSTRFELSPQFAKEMFLRAHFLMERLAAHQGDFSSFRLPDHLFSA